MIFWLATAASSLLLAILANIDRWRADWIPSATESWLNLLLTAAWACLAALAVFRKRGNEWLFVLLAIHVPALLADLYILSARGFPILPNLPGLLLKQALLFAAITLPAIAIATVVKSFTHFLLALAGIGLCLAILNGGGFQGSPGFTIQHHEIRDTAIRLILALAAVLTIEFKSRAIAIAGAVAAVAIVSSLPARVEYIAGTTPAPRISLRSNPHRPDPNHRAVLIPITIDRLPAGVQFHAPRIEIAGLKATRSSPRRGATTSGSRFRPTRQPGHPSRSKEPPRSISIETGCPALSVVCRLRWMATAPTDCSRFFANSPARFPPRSSRFVIHQPSGNGCSA